jgi:glycosyltransferase involved in cell wall biosynthesis
MGDMMDAPRTTTVVMTRNRAAELRRSLGHHRGPVIVVDNGSTDETGAMVRAEFPDVDLVTLPGNQGPVARNIGVERATTPLVAFADDDSWWEPEALPRAEAHFAAAPRLALLAGTVLVGPEARLDPVCREMAAAPLGTDADLPGPNVLGFLACGAVVRRSAYLAAGGFDDLIGFAGEEELLALDLAVRGWGLAYVDDVVARHHPSPSRADDARQVRDHRNRVLSAVMRRRWSVVARTTASSIGSRHGRRGLAQATAALAPALRRRRPIPHDLERHCDVLAAGGRGD